MINFMSYLSGSRASQRIGVNTLLIETLVFRRNSVMLSPMNRLHRLTMTSCQISMITPSSAWS